MEDDMKRARDIGDQQAPAATTSTNESADTDEGVSLIQPKP